MVDLHSDAPWLARPRPLLPISYVQITEDSGVCHGSNVYSCTWLEDRTPRYADLMQRQIAIHLAGAVGEAIHLGAVGWDELMAYATTDRERAAAVGDDLHRLTGQPYCEQRFFARTRGLLKANWPAVEVLASRLITHRRLEGDQIERIIDSA